MKKIIVTLLFAAVIPFFATAQNCQNPVSATEFQNGFNHIAMQQSDQRKLDAALHFINDKCLMADQVKNLSRLFTQDAFRFEFCKVAYAHTFDQVNFYDVYDAFTSFSYALRLHDYINGQGTTVVVQNPTNTPPPPPAQPVFPNYGYPDIANYNGKKGCNGPVISDAAFNAIAQNTFNQPTDESKYVVIQNASDVNCLSFAQLMKLTSLIQSENLRLKIMFYAFPRIFDQDHYQSGIVLFSSTQLQQQWTTNAQAYLTPPPPSCMVSDADFKNIMQTIKSKNFPDDKMNVLNMVSNDRCFSVAQVRTISKEFDFDADKLKVFRKLYARCTDQNNYYQLSDELTFSSDQQTLSDFIKNGGK